MEKILLIGFLVHCVISLCKLIKCGGFTERKDMPEGVSAQLYYLMIFKDFVLVPGHIILLVYFSFNSVFLYPDVMWQGCFVGTIMLVCFSAVLKLWAYAECGQGWSSLIAVQRNHCLVTTGPYNYVRHPIYVSYLLFALATVTSGNPFLVIFSIIYYWINVGRSKREEIALENHFGIVYKMYRDRVCKFVPCIVQECTIVGVFILVTFVGPAANICWRIMEYKNIFH